MIAEAVTTAALAGIFYLVLRRLDFWEGSVEQKERKARQSSAPGPAGLDVLFAEGERHLQAGRYTQAVERFRSVEHLNPKYPKLKNRLGIAYLEKGEYARAVHAFEQAVREDPGKPVRHANLAMAYRAVKKYSLAKKSLERAIQLSPESDKYKRLMKEMEEK